MKELIAKLSEFVDEDSPKFQPFDPASLLSGNAYSLADAVTEYFQTCIPMNNIELSSVTMLSVDRILMENSELIPGCRCAPYGLITFAIDMGGDSFSVDVTDGQVYRLSAGEFESDEMISPGWNEDCTAFLPNVPITRENIIKVASEHYDDITHFLENCYYWESSGGE